MKLNKKLGFIASLIVAMMPKGSKADLFLCAACPIGTYGKGDSLNCTPCPVGQYQDIVGQGSCKPCPAGKYQDKTGQSSCKTCNGIVNSSRTGCVDFNNLTLDNFTQIANVNPEMCAYTCSTGTLQPGWYLIRLRGGKGRLSYRHVGFTGKEISQGQNGANFNYVFYLPSSASYKLCLGCSGTIFNEIPREDKVGGGGGGGSWLKLNFGGKDYYFVAGGGAGAYAPDDYRLGGPGGGGGIGAGGGGGLADGDPQSASSPGLGSGTYRGGNGARVTSYFSAPAHPGEGLNVGNDGGKIKDSSDGSAGASGGGGGGRGGDGFASYYYNGENNCSESFYENRSASRGGSCAPITINIITGFQTTGVKTATFGGGYKPCSKTQIPASTSHTSNVPKIGACGDSCAILYKLK